MSTPLSSDAPQPQFSGTALPLAAARRYAPSQLPVLSVTAELSYVLAGAERPYNYMYEPPAGTPWHNCEYRQQCVPVADARHCTPRPSVHRQGFELWDAPSTVGDFFDEAAVRRLYYREVIELACAVTGASRGYVFDHQVRRREPGRPALGFGRHGDGRNPAAVGRVHNDYSEDSGRHRLALVLPDPAEAAAVARYSIVNVWRPIRGPVLDTPLAVCDARSVAAADLVTAEIRYADRSGEIYLLRHSPRHRWAYFHAMQPHEALVFKQYDSQVSGVARFTPHAAFDHPQTPPDAPLRQSIEARCLVVYD
jgi:hypothetical protein